MPNRLAQESSPYLLQHKDNPVDWFPWGPEAFNLAQQLQRPIFLSVGYSSCHWCHVMEHESFEDSSVAEVLNGSFISIKVDREERPDIDEAYMTAVQIASGRGGWPMSVFLTPDKKPFFAGTYFPKNDRNGSAGFLSILNGIERFWRESRAELLKSADQFAEALAETLIRTSLETLQGAVSGVPLANSAIAEILDSYDPTNGGFGQAPKFPPYSALNLLLDYSKWPFADPELGQRALQAAGHTLESMCLGGIYDQVGGGFHRYSTDTYWHLPHFEKMLYDNALLIGVLGKAAKSIPNRADLFTHTALRTAEWLQREMLNGDGLLGSALDADTDGEEGKFYVWSNSQLCSVLGEMAEPFGKEFKCTDAGNFVDEATHRRTGANVLHRESWSDDWKTELELLAQERLKRARPLFDHKALVCWNALAVDGLLAVGKIKLAKDLLDKLLDFSHDGTQVPHMVVNGSAVGEGFLDDHASLLISAIRILEFLPADQHERYQIASGHLIETLKSRFYDPEKKVCRSTSDTHEVLFGRTVPMFDQPIPSGNSLAIRALILSGDLDFVKPILQGLEGWMLRAPNATESLISCYLRARHPSEKPGEDIRKLEAKYSDGAIVIVIPPGFYLRNVSIQEVGLPVPYSVPAEPTEGFTDKLTITVRQKPIGELQISYQACTDWECLLPVSYRLTLD